MFIKLSVLVGIAALVGAAPAPIKHVLHEKRETASLDWVKGARIEKSAIIPMRIGLTQTNLEKGYDYLMEV
jgi:tripeptidyl-peptidase-1